MTVLPWPGRHWEAVPCAEPGTTSIRFPCVYRGTRLLCTATASDDQVTLEPLAGVKLEVPLAAWMQIAPYLTATALASREDLPPQSGRSSPRG